MSKILTIVPWAWRALAVIALIQGRYDGTLTLLVMAEVTDIQNTLWRIEQGGKG